MSKPLPPSAEEALAELTALLASGFTGTVTLECNCGGVTLIRQSTARTPGKRKPGA